MTTLVAKLKPQKTQRSNVPEMCKFEHKHGKRISPAFPTLDGIACKRLTLIFFIMSFAIQGIAQTFDFFKIQSVKHIATPPSKGGDIFKKTFKVDKNNKLIFSPYLEATVRVGERAQADTVYAKVYYYNKDKQLSFQRILRDTAKGG